MTQACYNMTPIAILLELFERLGACNGGTISVGTDELRQWPREAVKAMKNQKLIVKARPATSVICPGCERSCVMPVHTTAGTPSAFIVCDKRSDINRVPVPPETLTQWQCSADLVSAFVGSSLGLRQSVRQEDGKGRWEIGVVFGEKRSQMVCLEANGTVVIVAGDNKIPLAELIEFHDGAYAVGVTEVRRLVDAASTADDRYTPNNVRREARKLATQAMYESWRKEYRALRKRHPGMSDVWYSLQIAKMEIARGRDPETIRKQMKR
ncbi:MAG: hypothetical protein JW902_20010 [Syntrophaceae bacterium]|nr:hypothetical protein [Syntrophaceae bacterium]